MESNDYLDPVYNSYENRLKRLCEMVKKKPYTSKVLVVPFRRESMLFEYFEKKKLSFPGDSNVVLDAIRFVWSEKDDHYILDNTRDANNQQQAPKMAASPDKESAGRQEG